MTTGMWETVLNRLASQQATIEELRHEVQTLRHYPPAGATPKAPSEFEAPDAPVFKGERKELLPFLAKCHFKFESHLLGLLATIEGLVHRTHLEAQHSPGSRPSSANGQPTFLVTLPPEEIKDWERSSAPSRKSTETST